LKRAQNDAAVVQFERGLAIDPADFKARHFLAETYELLRNYDKALVNFTAVVQLAPATASESAIAETKIDKLKNSQSSARSLPRESVVSAPSREASTELGGGEAAADFPSRSITLVVPFPPGGGADVVARAIAKDLTRTLRQPVVIENKPGKGGVIGAEYAGLAKADGYTLFVGTTATQAIAPTFFSKVAYDPVSTFIPVALIKKQPMILVVNPNFLATNVSELLDRARQQPGKISCGSSYGGQAFFSCEMLGQRGNVKLSLIPYKGMQPALNDLMGGTIAVMMAEPELVVPLIRAGRLKALAVASSHRLAEFPQVPTTAESGLSDFESDSWVGLFVPVAVPRSILLKLHQAVVQAASSPEVKMWMGTLDKSDTPAEVYEFVKKEVAKWSRVVTISGAKGE